MRPVDLDTTGPVWTYAPESHKSEHHDKQRVIYLGPWAQQIIRLFMTPDHPITAPLLSPRHAEAERHAKAGTHRRPNQNPNVKKIHRTLGDHYTTLSYRRRIQRACHKAGVPLWSPHRLRHNIATAIRRAHGVELARILLGHQSIATTEIYAEADRAKAIAVIRKIG